MSRSLEDALNENPWSVSAIVFDLDDMLDDEGRPVSERRADAAARVGVEMEMRQCPFAGIRHDKWMNVSALAQITRYYQDILAEMAAFRRQPKGANATWEDILACIVELLAGPAIYLLQQRDRTGPVPARIAVGHKLAAGYFGVMRGLHERLAVGADIPMTVDTLLGLVDEMDALVGASEVCAGSPQMIRNATRALLEGTADDYLEIDPQRLDVARCLASQVQLGIFWRLHDNVHFWSLIRGEFREHLAPFNKFLEQKLERAGNDMDVLAPRRPDGNMLPEALDTQQRNKLVAALNDVADPQTLQEDFHTATELLNQPGSAIGYNGDTELFAQCVANYLNTYRLFEAELSRIELELRNLLGFPSATPICLGTAVFPTAKSLPWYELILGRRYGENGHLTGSSTGVRMAVPPR